jgi:Arc/MetJ-type ribon-helix-helix transcriptional regulator
MLALTPDLQDYLSTAVSTGLYRDEADALNQAVVLLRRRDTLLRELDEAHGQIEGGLGIESETVLSRLEERANFLASEV